MEISYFYQIAEAVLQQTILHGALKPWIKAFTRFAKGWALLVKPVSTEQTQQKRKSMLIFPRSWQVLTQMDTIQEHIHQASGTNFGGVDSWQKNAKQDLASPQNSRSTNS